MKNEIVTCIKNEHPLYDTSFKSNRIKIGKSYKCVKELVLTSPAYIIPEFASLQGITIKTKVDKWGWRKPCFPKECFRIATKSEVKKYKIFFVLKMPLRYLKGLFFRIIYKIDRVVRAKYYKELAEDYF